MIKIFILISSTENQNVQKVEFSILNVTLCLVFYPLLSQGSSLIILCGIHNLLDNIVWYTEPP